ncbi:MAG: EAL domain-containing protein [Comamonas sp.]
MRDTHTRVMLSLLGAGVLLAALIASDEQGAHFSIALGAWMQLLALVAGLATVGWGARVLLQTSAGGAPIGRPLWVCSAVVLGGYTVLAALPLWLAEHVGPTMGWTAVAVNLLLSISLLIISIDARDSARSIAASNNGRLGYLQLRSNAGVLVMLAAMVLMVAIVARGMASLDWVRSYGLPIWMLVCCAKAWLLTRNLVGRSSRWPVLSLTVAVAVAAIAELLLASSPWAMVLAQAVWCYALSVIALVLLMASVRHTLVGWASAHPQRLQGAEWLEQAPIGMVRVDGSGVIVHANKTQLDWLGVKSLVGQPWTAALVPALRAQAQDWIERLRAGESLAFEQSIETRHGMRHLQTDILVAPQGFDGQAFMLLSHDVSMQKMMAGRVQEQQSQLVSLVSAIPDLVVLKGVDGRFLHCNQAFERLVGLTHAQIIGRTTADLGLHNRLPSELETDLQAKTSLNPVVYEESLRFADNGYQGRFEITKSAVRAANGEVTGLLCISRDLAERSHARKEIERLEFFDVLTGLPNRRMLMDRLEWSIRACKLRASYAALLFIDLDNFKDLNDSLGHQQGDRLLCEVGKRLIASVRSGDVVARFGGDEFVVLVEHLGAVHEQAEAHVRGVVEHLLSRFNQPFTLDGSAYYSTPSIGVTVFGDGDVQSAEELLKRADMAMYEAKSAGRNTQRFFDPHMQAQVNARAHLESDLRQAIHGNELQVYYQPVMNGHGQLLGAEALVRWRHPKRGLVMPMDFIDLAEQTGLIVELGAFVMSTACLQLATWAQCPSTSCLTIAVNVSPRQFRNKGFVDEVLEILDETGANPTMLKLELTENLLLGDVNETATRMRELKERGVCFSLDDFGVGYSSLSYLKSLPLDQLKIDRSFVNDVLNDVNDAVIVRTILALAHNLELEVVAEGVENSDQVDFLVKNGCSRFQGYHFGRPVPIAEFERLHGFARCA